MLKRVSISDVELGMFVHKMEGGWLKHPFWKSRFLLDDPDNLFHLKSSELESVIIDTSKGKDLASGPTAGAGQEPIKESPLARQRAAPAPAPRAQLVRATALRSRQSIDLQSTDRVSTRAEVGAAQIVAEKAQQAVSKVFIDARLGKALNLGAVEPVVKDIFASIQRNPHAFSGLMRCKLNNQFVYRHSLAVSALMVSLAHKMKLSPKEISEAGLAGLFLDIGTNYLPQDLAPKNGDFRSAAPEIWQQHVKFGAAALDAAGNIPELVMIACLQHHEQMDGGGFPEGLSGPDIARIARMAAICDTFDYLLSDTELGAALDPTAAIVRLREMSTVFDSDILKHFIDAVGIHPIGSFVRMRSNRIGMVIDQDRDELTKPVVRTFYSLTSEQRIHPRTIELAKCSGEDEIVGVADLSGLVLPEEGQLRELIFLSAHKPDIKRAA